MAESVKQDIFGTPDRQRDFRRLVHNSRWIIVFVLVLLLGAGSYFGYRFFSSRNQKQNEAANAGPVQAPSTTTPVQTVPASTDPAGGARVSLLGDANYVSENFHVGDIAIGGEAEFLLTEDSPEPLAISDIRGEAFSENNKTQMKLVLTWKTNKLAQSEIGYSKGVGQPQKTLDEDDYSFNHSVVVPSLDQASTYVYTITSRDRFGNEIKSDPHAIYTGSKSVSLFDLIANAIGQVFGWAIKKN